jgi:ech hydrogenase subunit A
MPMEFFLAGLFFLPIAVSIILLVLPKQFAKILVLIAAFTLSAFSVAAYVNISDSHFIAVPAYVNQIVAGLDILLLLFFGWVAIRKKSILVGVLSIVQLLGLLYLLKILPHTGTPQFMVDKLSGFMFILINIISSIIAVFSIKYMEDETCSPFRRRYFLSTIFWFIAAMNLIVSSDNLEYFFLFFELTTLASFLLISFRKDKVSEANAVTALWMNQIGGVAILAGIFFIHYGGFGEATFSNLLANAQTTGIILPLALISIAALIKGAQMPFSKWLLGAMVAPTPVSALLHSSTMVKIAPFVILKLSPALNGTGLSYVIIALTAFVFVAAAIGALAQDNFKKILAHSTIALLALMIMMGALGTPVTVVAALMLMLFHGISKSMLFLNAGVLEKVFHVKETTNMDRLGEAAPFTAMVVAIGFMSLFLPPFGAFIGKWISIETLGDFTKEVRLLGALALVAVACGGAILTLLYFKVIGVMIARTGESDTIHFEKTGPIYAGTMYVLLALTGLSIFALPFLLSQYMAPVAADALRQAIPVSIQGWQIMIGNAGLPLVPLLAAFLILPATLVAAMFIKFKNVDRAKEYMCGEKINYSFGSFYLSGDGVNRFAYPISIIFFLALLVVAFI